MCINLGQASIFADQESTHLESRHLPLVCSTQGRVTDHHTIARPRCLFGGVVHLVHPRGRREALRKQLCLCAEMRSSRCAESRMFGAQILYEYCVGKFPQVLDGAEEEEKRRNENREWTIFKTCRLMTFLRSIACTCLREVFYGAHGSSDMIWQMEA